MKKNIVMVAGLLVAALATGSVQAAGDAAGKVLATGLMVSIKHTDGTMVVAAKGTELKSGDVISTPASADALVQLADGQKIYLKPGTEFKLENYAFDAEKPAEGVSFMKLVKGGVRTISGLIGKKVPDNYKLTTDNATIGIRGTDYSAVLCEAGTCDAGAADGLHVRVYEGKVNVVNAASSELVEAGLGAVVASSQSKLKSEREGAVGISDAMLQRLSGGGC